ncbi:hypothetical protein BGZ80_009348 [Entomortierella chlamydospora]|uniref:TFIIS N-terminal domain-containing protein n=1 Tax=Entomortierella chlamydospora TaxID=101097 RepID=A0A9P6MXR7_9FUNG|nr:hypothetical protein BGZ80_009348 [Entomortierella chlamydospora]
MAKLECAAIRSVQQRQTGGPMDCLGGWFGATELKSFDPTSAEKAKAALKNGNALKTALSEALDPSLIQAAVDADSDVFEDEDKQEQDADGKKKTLTKAKKATQKKETATKKRRPNTSEDQPVKRKVAKKTSVIEEDEEDSPEPRSNAGVPSRSRLESDFRSIDDDISIGDPTNGRTKRSDEDGGDSGDLRAKKKLRSGGPSDRLLKLRHKLQKLLLVEGLTDEVLVQNLDRADPILAEVEAFDIDLQMLKDTKIGRLMKKISVLQFSRDEHKVVERSIKLIKQYKSMMEKAQENGETVSMSTAEPVEVAPLVATTPLAVSAAGADCEQISTNAPLANSNTNGVTAVTAIVESNTVPAVPTSLAIPPQGDLEFAKIGNAAV